jgi:hypothetical protein
MALDKIIVGSRLFQVLSNLLVREITVEKVEIDEENPDSAYMTLRPAKGPRFKAHRYRMTVDGQTRLAATANLFETLGEAYNFAMTRAAQDILRARRTIVEGDKRRREAEARLMKLRAEYAKLD